MLYFVDGKNGSGKSLFAMHRIVLMLEASDKTIVTNMEEIKLPELHEFLAARRHPGDDPIDLHSRLVIIRKEDTPEYYRYRSGGLVLPPIKERDSMGKRIKADEFRDAVKEYFRPVGESENTRVGVCYFLDEVQDYFGAREWADTGRAVAWHVGKHRHLDDDVYWMTPCSEEVDAQLRRKCHQWYRLVNQYRMKIKGFRMPGGFKAYVFYSEPRPGVESNETIGFKLGDGYEKLYETTNALGVRGKPESKPPGWAPPFWMMVAGLCLAVIVGGAFLSHIPALVGKGIGHAVNSMNSGMSHSIEKSLPGRLADNGAAASKAVLPGAQRSGVSSDAPVTARGIFVGGQGFVAELSDGRFVSNGDRGVRAVGRDFLEIDGRRIPLGEEKGP